MRHLMIALALSMLTAGVAEARPPWDPMRPSDAMRPNDFSRRSAMPTPRMDSATMFRARQRLLKIDRIARPTGVDRMSARSHERAQAPNPFAKLEKAAVAKAMRNMQAKARFAGSPKGLREDRPRQASGTTSRVTPAPNPFAKLEKAAVAKAMRNMQAKARFAGSPKGMRNEAARPAARTASRTVREPNPFVNLEKAAVAKAMRNASAKAHFAGSMKGLPSDGSKRLDRVSPAGSTSAAPRIDRLGRAAQSRTARQADLP